jgi:hypothetical protein
MRLFAVVCIIAVHTSVALRVIKNPSRTFIQGLSESFQRTSNDAKLVQTKTIAALALFSVLSLGNPSPSFAANSGNIASDLFAKAESAISLNLQDYNTLDKEWTTAKKLITDNNNILLKASKSLGDVSKQMTGFDVIMSNMIDEDLQASQQLSAEIDALRLSAGAKYTAAKTSSSIPENPSITAPLYLSAEIEANVLEQSEISLKKFVDAIGPPGKHFQRKFFTSTFSKNELSIHTKLSNIIMHYIEA